MIVYPEGTPRCPEVLGTYVENGKRVDMTCGANWQWPYPDGDYAVWLCAANHMWRRFHGR